MTEPAPIEDAPAKAKGGGAPQILVEFGPVALFMAAYNLANRSRPDEAIYIATGLFIAATAAALSYAFFVQRRVPPMLLVSAAVIAIFGGLTIWLHDPVFIKIKPTIVNLMFAAAIFGGLVFKQNVWKILLRGSLDLPDRVWTIFAVRYGVFFIFLAGLNEIIWRTTSEAFWANFKFFGVLPLTLLFSAANMPLLLKHLNRSDAPHEPS